MVRRWHFWLAAVVVAASLVLGISSIVAPTGSRQAVPVPETTLPSVTPNVTAIPTSATPTPAPTTPTTVPSVSTPPSTTSTPTPAQRPTTTAPTLVPRPSIPPSPTPTPATGPPAGTVGTAGRYRAHYDGRYLGWDELISRGQPLPAPSRSCTASWRSSGKDGRLDWSAADHWCLTSLNGKAYKPQGIGGTATATGYLIGGRPAAERNLVLISWYSRQREAGLVEPNDAGENATKITVIDLDLGRYNTIQLVRPSGSRKFTPIDSHGSGVVWAGQYLYSSSKSVLWMYNADDLMLVDGKAVLPAVSRWSVSGRGGMSSISLDRSTDTPRLSAINYDTSGTTYVQTFELTSSGRLADDAPNRSRGLSLRNTYGGSGTVHSVSTLTVPGTNFQGVARTGSYTFANSSALKISGRKGRGDTTVVLKEGRVIKRLRMPRTNVESIYLDQRRGRFVSITEHGAQFLFAIPLASLITVAER